MDLKFGARSTYFSTEIWCEIDLKFGAKSPIFSTEIWCEIDLNLVRDRSNIRCEIDLNLVRDRPNLVRIRTLIYDYRYRITLLVCSCCLSFPK